MFNHSVLKKLLEGHKTHLIWMQNVEKPSSSEEDENVSMAHICESPPKGGAEVTAEPKPRPQLCARTQLGDRRSLMSCQHTGVNRGVWWGWHLFILPLLESHQRPVRMVWKHDDVLPIRTGGGTISFPPLQLPTWFSPPLASPASAPLHGLPTPPLSRGKRGDRKRAGEKKCEIKAQQFTSQAAA